MEIPPREPLLVTSGETVLYSSSINQILAWRGVGKTNFALALAGALASGGRLLDFNATRPTRTLYLDGELPDSQLQERARLLTAPTDNLVLISADQTGPLNLRKEEHWEMLKTAIAAHGSEVVVLDSLSTLFRQEMNEERELLVLQERLQELRS
jgi:putative DNA primase/helicase